MNRAVILAVASLLAPACYLKPSRTNNPLRSSEGVRITLVGQDCEDHRGADGDPVSRDLGVQVQFENPTDQVLHIAEGSIRLVVDDDSAAVASAGIDQVAPHSARTIVMSFTHHALCESSRQFKIAWNDALTLGDHPIAVAALTFSP